MSFTCKIGSLAAAAAFLVIFFAVAVSATGLQAAGETGGKGAAVRDIGIETQLAARLVNEGRYAEASGLLESILMVEPMYLPAVETLSQCYLKAGRPEDAARLIERSVDGLNRPFSLVRDLGTAYLDTDREDMALKAWHSVLTGKEGSGPYYELVARLEWDAGMYDRAIETLREGKVFPEHFSRNSREIIRLLGLLGRNEEAFIEGIDFISGGRQPVLRHTGFILETFREAGSPDRLVSFVDSLAAENGRHRDFLKLLHAVLLVETDRYEEAERYVMSLDDSGSGTKMSFDFIESIFSMKHKRGAAAYDVLVTRTANNFLERHEGEAIADGVRYMLLLYRYEQAAGTPGEESGKLEDIRADAGGLIGSPFGGPYRERAAILKATIEMERLHLPRQALSTLDAAGPGDGTFPKAATELMIDILLALDDREMAMSRMGSIASSPDSTIAAAGKYGLGKLNLLGGNYEEAVDILSTLAKESPGSDWSNDALEAAILVKEALAEGNEGLDIYSSALSASMRGGYIDAADLLGRLATLYPASVLAGRARYERSLNLEEAGMIDDAAAELEELAESYPLDEFAPRALERLGVLRGDSDPRKAARFYAEFLERYPEDPFSGRVRSRYAAIIKKLDESGRAGERE